MVFTPADKNALEAALSKWYDLANNSSDSDPVTTANSVTKAQYDADPSNVIYYGNPNTWDVTAVTDMSKLFENKTQNNHPDISTWDVSSVTNMREMFRNARAFNQAIGQWNVSQVTNMREMFYGAAAFNQPIGQWNVGNVTNMYGMFWNTAAFNQDISGWNVGNVTKMDRMFSDAVAFNQPIGQWNVGNVTNMARMFWSATAFNQDISGWNVGNVTSMGYMFYFASAFNQNISYWNVNQLTELNSMFLSSGITDGTYGFSVPTPTYDQFNKDLPYKPASKTNLQNAVNKWYELANDSSDPNAVNTANSVTKAQYDAGTYPYYGNPNTWDVSGITDMSNLFRGKNHANHPNISNWNVGNVTNMYAMFLNAAAFNGDISQWNVSNVTDMYAMFYNVAAFNQDISQWNVSQVRNMRLMFLNAAAFNGDISQWNVSNVTDMYAMFYNVAAFNQDISQWNVSQVTDMSWMFYGAAAFNQDISGWNVSSVTTMYSMFSGAAAFNQDISGWNVSSVTTMYSMFSNAAAFNQEIGQWNVSSVTSMSYMFQNAAAFNGDVSGWDVSSVTSMRYMFQNAAAFNGDISGWDVSSVRDMREMFKNAAVFNQPIENWNTSKVTNMSFMFSGASSFNQPIGTWNTSNVVNMSYMFYNASAFNKSLGTTYNPDGMIPTGSVDFTLDLIDTYKDGWQNNPNFYGNIDKGVTLKDENGNIINDKHGNPIDNILLHNLYDTTDGNVPLELRPPPYDKKTIEFTVPNIETTKLYITTGDEYWDEMKIVLSTPDYPYAYEVEGTSAENKTDELFLDYERFEKTIKASNDYWNTLNVQNMSYMFACEEGKTMKFNGDIGIWNMNSITNISGMFQNATAFDNAGSNSIDKWFYNRTSEYIIDFTNAFNNASNFCRKITAWNVREADIVTDMLTGTCIIEKNLYGFTSGTPSYTLFNQPICFNKGTKILCYVNDKEVYVPIEKLRKDMLVKTYKHGYKKIDSIKTGTYRLGRSSVGGYDVDQGMYKMVKEGEMIADLEMTGLHSILVDRHDAKYKNDIENSELKEKSVKNSVSCYVDDKYRLKTKHCSKFIKMKRQDYTVYTFSLEHDREDKSYGIWANGLLVETTPHCHIKKMTGAKDLVDDIVEKKQ